ncbi:MAG: Ig-like domain-containing protein, partial [Lachnospiraceae bacterium]|nr:Ig-like domain-containing protein [Lachnospiraceae bacterium]
MAYQKVDVADEVKKESEINVAKEEATQQNTVQESALQDTVEWVESTKTPIGEETAEYEKVSSDKIADPWITGSAFRKMVEEGEEEDPYENVKVTLNKNSLSLDQGESASLQVSVSNSSVRYSVEWDTGDSSIATVSGEGAVTAVAPGSTTVTARVAVGSMIQTLDCSVTVNNPEDKEPDDKEGNGDNDKDKDKNENGEVVYKKISISGPGEVAVGKTVTLSAQTDPKGGKISWSSEDEKIAKVDDKGVVTGVGEGTVKIRALCKSSEDITESVQIKVVKEAVVIDGSTKLKDKDGNQLYYRNSAGEYKEATYDDYGKRDTFYKKVKSSSAYKYTGWQTIDGYVYFYDKNGNYVTGDQVIQGARYTFGSDGKLAKSSGT